MIFLDTFLQQIIFLLFIFNLLFSNLGFGQINYPFTKEGNNNLQAYWYNIPSDSVKNKDNDKIIFNFVSLLQIYGPVISNSFEVKAEVYLADINEFSEMNEVYDSKFTNEIKPARQAMEVVRLPLNAKVEISFIAHIGEKK